MYEYEYVCLVRFGSKGGGGGGVRRGYTGFGTLPQPLPSQTKKYPNSIKIWTF